MSLQEDDFPAAEKILADLDNVFRTDPELEDFFIIPVSGNQNKSPVVHADHSLGLESWCVQHLYCYVYGKLINHKTRKKREDPKVVARLLRGALLINPETAAFWNMMKQLIESERVGPEEDLRFSAVVLGFKPKCSEVFTHRKWVLRKMVAQADVQPMAVLKYLQAELRITQLAASKYPSNYNAWNHRKWVLEALAPKGGAEQKELLKQELKLSHCWTSNHVSDYSGLQYRQYVMQTVFSTFRHEDFLCRTEWLLELPSKVEAKCCSSCAAASVLEQELQMLSELIVRYEGHESLWYHRRFVLHSLQKVCVSAVCAKLGASLFNSVVGSERAFASSVCRESKLAHENGHASRHLNWIENVLRITAA
ncbi:Hypothetical predicted protein [Cloeon dipterum]|uniref:Protein prenyltransferase alpha subunit repeat-containing protein 1 n=1 Tax=Cloeon dipterum TaxID=197152 RepID=A0A8S1EDY5_9INSE|nr:Hypothetical predicted protein [Cloeon dipterum]